MTAIVVSAPDRRCLAGPTRYHEHQSRDRRAVHHGHLADGVLVLPQMLALILSRGNCCRRVACSKFVSPLRTNTTVLRVAEQCMRNANGVPPSGAQQSKAAASP